SAASMRTPGRVASAARNRRTSGSSSSTSIEVTGESLMKGCSTIDVTAERDPVAKTAGHGLDFPISHLLQRVRGKRRPVPIRAVDDDTLLARHQRLDLRLHRAARQVHRTRDGAQVYLWLLTYIEKDDIGSRCAQRDGIARRNFLDARACLVEQLLPSLVRDHSLSVSELLQDTQGAFVRVELRIGAEWYRPLVGHVSDRRAGDTWHSQSRRDLAEHVLECARSQALLGRIGRQIR